MTPLGNPIAVLGIAVTGVSATVPGALADGAKTTLRVNRAPDDRGRVAGATGTGHQKTPGPGHDRVTIRRTVPAARLAETRRPSHLPGLMADSATISQGMPTAFIADQGQVSLCGARPRTAGPNPPDPTHGGTLGTWPVVGGMSIEPDLKSLAI